MIHVRLFCGAGMSTSLLARKMTEYAASKGIEAIERRMRRGDRK